MVCLTVASSCKGVFDFEHTYTWVVHILFLERESGTFIHDRVGMVSLPEHLLPSWKTGQTNLSYRSGRYPLKENPCCIALFFCKVKTTKTKGMGRMILSLPSPLPI